MSGWLTPEVAGQLADGLVVTVALTVLTTISSLALGIGVGAARVSGGRMTRRAAGAFVEVFRNVPALIQIIFWAFAFPSAFPTGIRATLFFDNPVVAAAESVTGLSLPYYAFAACLGLTLNTGAHLAELFRAGAGTVARSQVDAARLLGAGPREVQWSIVVPGAVRGAFPAITTRLIHNMKNTALASFVAVPELFQTVQASITQTFRAIELLALAAAVYLGLAAAMGLALQRADVWLHRGRDRVAPS